MLSLLQTVNSIVPLELIFPATILLWIFFIFVIILKNECFNPDHNILIKIPLYIIGYTFLIVDVAYNVTYGTILFLEPPHLRRLTLTARLKHILHSDEHSTGSWRYKLALFMCMYMIEPWDFGHCSLHKL